MPKVDLTGRRFGRLEVIEASPSGYSRWQCICDCGTPVVVGAYNLNAGKARSCGCLRTELKRARRTIHGMSRSAEYNCWEGMRTRCECQNNHAYRLYGGRGITVCERWSSFENFLADMGRRPPGTSLDRIDTNGNYEPGNCRWATSLVQQRNRTNNVVKTYDGVTAPISELCERFGRNPSTVRNRIRTGASIEVAMRVGRLPRGTIKPELKAQKETA